jgi:hypothetical protein
MEIDTLQVAGQKTAYHRSGHTVGIKTGGRQHIMGMNK